MKTASKALAIATAIILSVSTTSGIASAACGDFDGNGSVSATDSLGVLSTAIGISQCELRYCDVDGNGSVAATDALAVLNFAVGATSALSCTGTALTTIDELPRATSPVVSGDTGAAFVLGAEFADNSGLGIVLGEMDNSTFNENSSMAACQIASMARTTLEAAAEADKVLCYIQNAFADLELEGIDIYDGDYHTFRLNFIEMLPINDEYFNAPAVVRMRLERQGDSIRELELFTCNYAAHGLRQNEYIRQTIDGGDFAMVAKGVVEDEWSNGRFAHQITVDAQLNAVGQIVGTKTIAISHGSEWQDGGSNYGQTTVSQSAVVGSAVDALALDGYDGGSSSDGISTWAYSNRVTAIAELFDLNQPGTEYDIGRLALGDGAAKLNMANRSDYNWSENTEVQGWNGTTTELDYEISREFVDVVIDADLVEVSGVPEIAFAPDETYPCDIRPEAILDVNMVGLADACSHLDVTHEWFDCSTALYGGDDYFPPEPEPCEGPDCTCWVAGSCGGQAPAGCYCDWECQWYGDCCADACDMCGSCDTAPCEGSECDDDVTDPDAYDPTGNDPTVDGPAADPVVDVPPIDPLTGEPIDDGTVDDPCVDPTCVCDPTDVVCLDKCQPTACALR